MVFTLRGAAATLAIKSCLELAKLSCQAECFVAPVELLVAVLSIPLLAASRGMLRDMSRRLLVQTPSECDIRPSTGSHVQLLRNSQQSACM
jgi:hypothetical protein